MKRSFDRVDLLAAFGLFVAVAAWAFLWAHPCPHPDLWPFLVTVRGRLDAVGLGIAGRLALGVFAAFVYLLLRGFWFLHRDEEDELPDNFLYTRTAPICGAAALALLPYSWRAGQFLSPGFALVMLTAIGLFLWLRGRGGLGYFSYSSAYLIFGFVCGANPLGFVSLILVAASDVILRWQTGQDHGQREDETVMQRRKSIEAWFSIFTGTIGFVLGIRILMVVMVVDELPRHLVVWMQTWWTVWTKAAVSSTRTPAALALVLSVLIAFAGLATGRRIRSVGPQGRVLCRVMSGLLAVATLAMLLRAVDRPERVRLQAMREYAALVAEDVRDAKYLFTDGRFDDLLRLEFASRGMKTVVLNALAAPAPSEADRLKMLAPEPGDRAIFEAGGAEVFKAWARERPDRLAESAWQLGGNVVRRHGKTSFRTHGSVMRCTDAAQTAAADAADVRFTDWSQRIRAVADDRPVVGSLFGATDDAVAARFDALLWRAARLAGERKDRQLMMTLDGLNESLRTQGEVIERMLPTEKLVLTARESLEVALKRADFDLARRYAGEVLAGAPDDSAANFALGMANMEAKEYFKASVCFEKALAGNPNEPAALNNLAITYMKLNRADEALACAERAAKVHPNSPQIRQTLAEIRKNVRRTTPAPGNR